MDNILFKVLCLFWVSSQCYGRAAKSAGMSSRGSSRPPHPPAVMHGDLCARLKGRKFYLEPDASALLYAFNVTLPPLPKVAHALPRPPPRRHRRDESLKDKKEDGIGNRRSSFLSPKTFTTDSVKDNPTKKLNNTYSNFTMNSIYGLQKLNDTNPNYATNSKTDTELHKHHTPDTKNKIKQIKRLNVNAHDLPRIKSILQQSSRSKGGKIVVKDRPKSVLQKEMEFSDIFEKNSPIQNTANHHDISLLDDGIQNIEDEFYDAEIKITDNARKFSANINGLSTLIEKNEQEMQMMRDQAEVQNSDESYSSMVPALSKHLRCGIELFTCPDCHLEFTFRKINLPSCSHDQTCRCDYLRLREPPYIGSSGGLDVCSSGASMFPTYTTQTREVSIDFFYTTNYRDAFTISVISKRNKYRIQESSRNGSTGYIRSPFFPELYPKDYWVEYELLALNDNGRVKITFLDFQISPWSFVEIQDTNESRLAVFSGNIFRPPVLISSGPHMTIRFNANGETARGFSLQYSFIAKDSFAMLAPMSDCGGYVTNFGGTITMMNMAKGGVNASLYDCVWIIQPPQNFAFKTHVLIKVVQFEQMAAGALLELRQGLTSDDYLLEKITGGIKQTSSKEHVVSVDTGFYVRLQGFFSIDSKVAIVYTSFSVLGNCYAMTDHMCHNHRCIPKMLRCDGFDHCGDGSDEPASCYGSLPGEHHLTPEDQAWWYQHTPNYYFPQKNNIFTSPYGSSMMLMFSLFVLILIIIGLVSYMVKQGNQESTSNRRQRDRNHRDRNNIDNDVEIYDAAADDPPVYEPPPDYEEVIKFILSGNNLKLVRRPGGLTAWMPDVPKTPTNSILERNEDGTLKNSQIQSFNHGNEAAQHLLPNQNPVQRPLRTRHASLDMEQGEVVLWNSNTNHISDNSTEPSRTDFVRQHSSPLLPNVHTRRSSLPSAPQPELMQGYTAGHSVSMAPATIMEIPEGTDSPLLGTRIIIPKPLSAETISVTQIIPSSNNDNFDDTLSGEISSESTSNLLSVSSEHSAPGPSTQNSMSKTVNLRKTKSKNAGKRRKTSAAKKSMRRKREEEVAPPSYEMAMQQTTQTVPSPVSDSTGTQTENILSTEPDNNNETSNSVQKIDNEINMDNTPEASTSVEPLPQVVVAESSLLPSQRIKTAREKFQELSKNESNRKDKYPSKVSYGYNKARNTRSGGTISKGTVKARKAMLMRVRTPSPCVECNCNGACSCVNFKNLNEPTDDCVSSGAVKTKVDYYLNIDEHLKKDDVESSEQLVKATEIKDIGKSSKVKKINSPYNKEKKVRRHKSNPHSQFVNNRDLDIYFSQNDENNVQDTIDITEEIIKISKNQNEGKNVASTSKTNDSINNSCSTVGNDEEESDPESSEIKKVSSIRQQVNLYNELAKNNEIPSVDSAALLNGENGEAIISMQVFKSPTLDSEIKFGIVKDAKKKYIASTMEESIQHVTQNTFKTEDAITPFKQINQDPKVDEQLERKFNVGDKQTQEHSVERQNIKIDLNECQGEEKSVLNIDSKSKTGNKLKSNSANETPDLSDIEDKHDIQDAIDGDGLPLMDNICKSKNLEKGATNEIDKIKANYTESGVNKDLENATTTSAIFTNVEEIEKDNNLVSKEVNYNSISTNYIKDKHDSELQEEIDNLDVIQDGCANKNKKKKKMKEDENSKVIIDKLESRANITHPLNNEETMDNQRTLTTSPSNESATLPVKEDTQGRRSPNKSDIKNNVTLQESNIIKNIKEADMSLTTNCSRSNSPFNGNEDIIDPITEYIRGTTIQEDGNERPISITLIRNDTTDDSADDSIVTPSSSKIKLREIPQQSEEILLPSDPECNLQSDVSSRSGIIVVKDGSQIRWDYI